MNDVPAEWFDAADNARNAALRKDANDQIGALLAALAAVTPLIAKAERERCAGVAQDKADAWAKEWRDSLKASSHTEGMSDGADEVAAAIRALD
jgi:hypothetical protein